MKRIIFFISLLVGLGAAAQEPVNTYLGGLNTKTIVRNDLQIDSLLYLPLRDTNFTPLRKGILIFRSTDSALYVSTSTVAASKWTKVGATPSGGAWGTITGTLSSQTDLVAALAAKQNLITTGTTSQYIRGDLSLGTLSSAVTSITDPLYSPVAHSHSGLIPIGGSTNQVLTKNSSTNYDYSWQDPSAGSGTVTNVSGGLWIGGGPITTTGSLNVDSAALFTYGLRRKDSVAGGYYPYSSNPKNYLTSSTIPLTSTYIARGNVSNVLYGDAGLTYNGTVMYVSGILNPSQYVATKWYRLAPMTTPDVPNTFDNPGVYYNQDSLKYGFYFPDTDSWRYTDFLNSGGLGSSSFYAFDGSTIADDYELYVEVSGGDTTIKARPAASGTLDATPTNGSTNGIESNAVYDGLALKEATFTETTQEFTGSTSLTLTLSNTLKTSKAVIVYYNGLEMENAAFSASGTTVTLSGLTRETSDRIKVKYSY